MNEKQPLTFAIILNYDSSSETVGLYGNLISFNYPNFEIIVIDNCSSSADVDELKNSIPSENLVLNNKNSGYAGGNNIGIKLAFEKKADYVWILNPDIRIQKDTFPTLLKTFDAAVDVAAVAPRILKREEANLIFSDGEIISKDEICNTYHLNHNVEAKKVSSNINFNIDYLDGSRMLIAGVAFKEIGPFSEEYFLYFEETDWCFRAREKGWKLAVNSRSSAFNLTSEKGKLFHYYMMRNRLIFAKKFHPHFGKVRSYYIQLFLNEILLRMKGKYFRPFYFSRFKGLIFGLLKTA